MNTALITGASSGIGWELSKIFAQHKTNLVVVARNQKPLENLREELEKKYGISVKVIAMDLSAENAVSKLFAIIKTEGIRIDYLVNNAGFGLFGDFQETDWNTEKRMIDLNITAVAELTKVFLPEMLARNSGKIMNVASTAAFQPGPGMAVYYATKAFVLHFSEAVSEEISHSNVSITALCPGPTSTSFFDVADLKNSLLLKILKPSSAESVAKFAYKKMMQGKTVVIPGFLNKLIANSVRFTPRFLVRKIVKKVQSKNEK